MKSARFLKRPRISLCMIVRNEEQHLDRCLTSVKAVVDEICIVDTGSTDGTVRIAENHGAKLTSRPWDDDFSAARNASLEMASGDWVLHLDADEELSEKAINMIPALVQRPGTGAYILPVDSYVPSGISRAYCLRLFQRDPRAQYRGRIHEDIGPALESLGITVATAEAPVWHYGYREDPMVATGKRSRNRSLLIKSLEEQPGHPWYVYYLAVEEFLAGEPEAALGLLNQLAPSNWIEGQPSQLQIQALMVLGRWGDALAAAETGVRQFPKVLNLWNYTGSIAFAKGRYDLCREAVQVMRNPPANALGYRPPIEASANYLAGCMEEDKEQAARLWYEGRTESANCRRALFRHVLKTRGLDETVRLVGDLTAGDGRAAQILLQALIDLQDWGGAIRVLEQMPPELVPQNAGTVFWAQGDTDGALQLWSRAGKDGWRYYGIVAALFGDPSDLAPVLEHLRPLEAQALTELQRGEPTWRLTSVLNCIWDLGQVNLVEQIVERAPALAEAVGGHYRLYIEP